ncbi:hypothetical protein PsorP6_000886 [Peronosclerospora sorghi]|uniref:Uncharacterized protein n=1 Tax=Peronosclerospora sorghi TaxID=230839 RepID=A0ACC0WT74_9STRA|nr:hypothetical protein PsorP6_000886 [Peronosclerospora sorghi]
MSTKKTVRYEADYLSTLPVVMRLLGSRPFSALLSCLWLCFGHRTNASKALYSLNLTGIASGTAYTLTVKIGTLDPSSSKKTKKNAFRLIVDTGSSNDAVLGSGCCGEDAEVTYSCDASPTCRNSGDSAVTLAFAGAKIEYVRVCFFHFLRLIK